MTGQFTQDLRALYETAGSPPYLRVVSWAKQQNVPLGATTLCDWLNGRTVPSDPRVLRFLVTELERRANVRAPSAYQVKGPAWWEAARQSALAERHGRQRTVRSHEKPRDSGESRLSGLSQRASSCPWLMAVVSTATGAVIALASLTFTHQSVSVPAQDAVLSLPAPTIVDADGRPEGARQVQGSESALVPIYAVDNVTGSGSCPPGWACLYENPQFNASPGWMLMTQDGGHVYDFEGEYDKSVSSWINRTGTAVTLYTQHHAHGLRLLMDPGAGDPSLGDVAVSSIHIPG